MTTPTAAPNVLKVVSIDDLGLDIVTLPQGVWLIDNEVVSVSYQGWASKGHQISVENVDSIHSISKHTVLRGYKNKEDGSSLSVEDYNHAASVLLKNSTADEDGDVLWSDLDSEFAYRKWRAQWERIAEEVTEYSSPWLLDRTHIRQDTGNHYIQAGFLTGKADVPLYSYSRSNAVAGMMAEKFNSLGMVFQKGTSYGGTEGKHIWSNSEHSGLEYVVAFGKYIFNKQILPKTRGEFKGSFDHLDSIYQEDKKWIESHIQTLYNLHFRNEAASGVLLSEVSDKLKAVLAYVNTLDVKVKSETSKRSALAKINEAIECVNKEVLEK